MKLPQNKKKFPNKIIAEKNIYINQNNIFNKIF